MDSGEKGLRQTGYYEAFGFPTETYFRVNYSELFPVLHIPGELEMSCECSATIFTYDGWERLKFIVIVHF